MEARGDAATPTRGSDDIHFATARPLCPGTGSEKSLRLFPITCAKNETSLKRYRATVLAAARHKVKVTHTLPFQVPLHGAGSGGRCQSRRHPEPPGWEPSGNPALPPAPGPCAGGVLIPPRHPSASRAKDRDASAQAPLPARTPANCGGRCARAAHALFRGDGRSPAPRVPGEESAGTARSRAPGIAKNPGAPGLPGPGPASSRLSDLGGHGEVINVSGRMEGGPGEARLPCEAGRVQVGSARGSARAPTRPPARPPAAGRLCLALGARG